LEENFPSGNNGGGPLVPGLELTSFIAEVGFVLSGRRRFLGTPAYIAAQV
jgi:hypothetical protein